MPGLLRLQQVSMICLVSAVVLLVAKPSWADDDVNTRIESLEQELLQLKEMLKTQSEVQEETMDAIESQNEVVRSIEQNTVGLKDTSIGGYAELNWANFDGDKKDEFDVQRFIIFLGHSFSDKTRMMSEIEFEHAQVKGGESGGEVAMEQAYIEHTIKDGLNMRAGLQIVPIGRLAQFGVRRAYSNHP